MSGCQSSAFVLRQHRIQIRTQTNPARQIQRECGSGVIDSLLLLEALLTAHVRIKPTDAHQTGLSSNSPRDSPASLQPRLPILRSSPSPAFQGLSSSSPARLGLSSAHPQILSTQRRSILVSQNAVTPSQASVTSIL